jgi:CMP-N-acetylneuraminic acid synthetase
MNGIIFLPNIERIIATIMARIGLKKIIGKEIKDMGKLAIINPKYIKKNNISNKLDCKNIDGNMNISASP